MASVGKYSGKNYWQMKSRCKADENKKRKQEKEGMKRDLLFRAKKKPSWRTVEKVVAAAGLEPATDGL